MVQIDKIIFSGVFPFPPSVNNYYKQNRYTKYRSKKGMDYIKTIANEKIEQCLPNELDMYLSIFIRLNPPNEQADIDNYHKCLLDALQYNKVYNNDNQIKELHTIMGRVKKGGSLLVICYEFDIQLLD